MKRLLFLVATALSALSFGAAPASADPFYCDGVGPSVNETINCAQTGVCFWEDIGGGLYLVKCYYYCDVYWCS